MNKSVYSRCVLASHYLRRKLLKGAFITVDICVQSIGSKLTSTRLVP